MLTTLQATWYTFSDQPTYLQGTSYSVIMSRAQSWVTSAPADTSKNSSSSRMVLTISLTLCMVVTVCQSSPPPTASPPLAPSCLQLGEEKQPTMLEALLDFFYGKKAVSPQCQNATDKLPEVEKNETKVPSAFKVNYMHWEKNNI